MNWEEYKKQLNERLEASVDPAHPLIVESIEELRKGLGVKMGSMIVVNDPAFSSIAQILERRQR